MVFQYRTARRYFGIPPLLLWHADSICSAVNLAAALVMRVPIVNVDDFESGYSVHLVSSFH